MNTDNREEAGRTPDRRALMEDAIRTWHRGQPLTDEQLDLVHEAGVVTFARALRHLDV